MRVPGLEEALDRVDERRQLIGGRLRQPDVARRRDAETAPKPASDARGEGAPDDWR
jgi:hypothetical protein